MNDFEMYLEAARWLEDFEKRKGELLSQIKILKTRSEKSTYAQKVKPILLADIKSKLAKNGLPDDAWQKYFKKATETTWAEAVDSTINKLSSPSLKGTLLAGYLTILELAEKNKTNKK